MSNGSKGPVQIRRGPLSEWLRCDTVLLQGEVGFITDELGIKILGFKVGNAIQAFSELRMFSEHPYEFLSNDSPLSAPVALVYGVTGSTFLLCDTTLGPVRIEVKPSPSQFIDVIIMDVGGMNNTYPIQIIGQSGALVNKQASVSLTAPYCMSRLVSVPGMNNWALSQTSIPSDYKLPWANITDKPTSFPPSNHAVSHGVDGTDPISIANLVKEISWNDIANKPLVYPTSWASIENKPTGFPAEAAFADRVTTAENNIANLEARAETLSTYTMGAPDWANAIKDVALPYMAATNGYMIALLGASTTVLVNLVPVASVDADSSARIPIAVKGGQTVSVGEGSVLQATFVPAFSTATTTP